MKLSRLRYKYEIQFKEHVINQNCVLWYVLIGAGKYGFINNISWNIAVYDSLWFL